ncbi:erythromycin esterase family protein [Fusibacter bizertensis]
MKCFENRFVFLRVKEAVKIKKKHVIIVIVLAIVCLASIGAQIIHSEVLSKHLKAHIIPIKTTKANNGFDDLTPLKEILENKKIIGMGEATHGTADFFQMKHRMFEFLVEEMGYRIIVMEVQFGAGQAINDYILNGKGTLENCIDALMQFTVTSTETLEMLQWMKDFNIGKDEKDQIKFYGYDMQMIDGNLNQILPYLQKVNSKAVTDKKTVSLFLKPFYAPKDQEMETFGVEIEHIYNDLISNKSDYIKKSSEEEFELMVQNIAVIKQWIVISKEKNHNKMFDLRDEYAAENIQWISNYEDCKIMLWAHNEHIANSDNKSRLLEVDQTTLGENLKRLFKDAYYSIGFDFYKGHFVAVSPKNKLSVFELSKSPKSSFAYEMMKTNTPIGFLDINNAKKDKVLSDFISTKVHINAIGANFNGSVSLNPRILKESFDGIIFVNTTTGAKFNAEIDLNDGNKELIISNSFKLVAMFILFIILFSAYKKRMPTIAKREECDVLGAINGDAFQHDFLNLVLKFNQYSNSISSYKFSVWVILGLTILMGFNSWILPIEIIQGGNFGGSVRLALINLSITALMTTVFFLVAFVLPLSLLKKVSKEKEIGLKQILSASFIGAIIYSTGLMIFINMFLKIGLSTYLLHTIIAFFIGLVICYSYLLFSYKWEKPALNIFLIVFFQEFIISIISISLSIIALV